MLLNGEHTPITLIHDFVKLTFLSYQLPSIEETSSLREVTVLNFNPILRSRIIHANFYNI